MNVKGNHPLAEILAKSLLGIESVPREHQKKMVNRAIKSAVEFYGNRLANSAEQNKKEIKEVIERLTTNLDELKALVDE